MSTRSREPALFIENVSKKDELEKHMGQSVR